jgi:6-phosphofructokinase 1
MPLSDSLGSLVVVSGGSSVVPSSTLVAVVLLVGSSVDAGGSSVGLAQPPAIDTPMIPALRIQRMSAILAQDMPDKTIAVLTSGGDSPGMNAAVRAIVKVAASRGVAVVGVEDGYSGLLAGRLRPLTQQGSDGIVGDPDIDFWGSQGGTLLGSARELRFMTAEGRAPAVRQLAGMAGLVVIGGNGSLGGAHALAQESGVPVIGIPASIDNDVGCTSTAIGVDTALNTIVASCDKICDTARAHHRAFVVEVMGRDCGYLAMASAVAVGADAVLFREQGRSEEQIVSAVEAAVRRAFAATRGKQRVLILKAEGVGVPCTALVRQVQDRIAIDLPSAEVRATVLGHLVRGGNPTFQDRMVAGRLGLAAVEAVLAGRNDEMAAWMSTSTSTTDGGTKTIDPAVTLHPLARVLDQSHALVDGTSPLTKRRVQMMEKIEGVLGL